MITIPRSRLIGLISTITLATGAAAVTGLTQAGASDLPAFTCSNTSGGVTGAAATVTSISSAHHSGYDRLVIGFATSNNVPQYDVQRQGSSTFIRDASGQAATLQGSAGVKAVLRNSDVVNGVPADLKPGLPEIREVANIGNFERVVSYGVGLKDQACLRVFQLSGPSRLVIDVQTPPDAAPAAAAPTQPAVSIAASSAPDAAAVPQGLATTGSPASASQPSLMPLAATFLGLLGLAAGITVAAWYRFMRR